MTPPPRSITQTASRCGIMICAVAALLGCSAPKPGPRPLLTGSALTASGVDPSQTPFRSWESVDRAVAAGAVEHLVVATPIEQIGDRYRTYTLLGPHDQPGEMLLERTAGGISLTIRLGRFGLPELEAAVLGSVRDALSAPPED